MESAIRSSRQEVIHARQVFATSARELIFAEFNITNYRIRAESLSNRFVRRVIYHGRLRFFFTGDRSATHRI